MRYQGRVEERSDIMNKLLSQGFLSKERIEQFNRQNTFQPENVPANQTEN